MRPHKDAMITNRSLLLPYAAPYLAYVCIASILGDHLSTELNYLLRIILCTVLLLWAWKWYIPMAGPRSPLVSVLTGIPAGIIGLFLWISLLAPFSPESAAKSWTTNGFLLRMLAATLLVPLIEEILIRGYILRLAFQWWDARKKNEAEPLHSALDEKTIDDVAPGAWSWMAVVISTLVFTAGHHFCEWPAAIAYGLLMATLWILRKDLICCIVAHGVTNLSLAVYVVKTGSYHLW